MTIHFKLTGAFALWNLVFGMWSWHWVWLTVALDIALSIYWRKRNDHRRTHRAS